jgi:AraC-like DNA-binding protein
MRHDVLSLRHRLSRQPAAGGHTVSAAYLRMLSWGAEAQGLAVRRILADAGVDAGVLDQRGARVPIQPVARAWEQIVERLGDPLVGLRLADSLPFGTGDVLDYLARSSATTEQSLEVIVRYAAPLMNDSDQIALVLLGKEARMRIRTAGDVPYTTELVTGLFARRSRELYGPSWSLRSVSFAHARRGPQTMYDRLFRAPVHFGMPFNEAVFDRDLLRVRMGDADPHLNAILTAQADGLIAGLGPTPAPSSFIEAVEDALARGLAEGDGTLTRVADHLHMSPRTVQRRLRQAGLSHRAMLDKLRFALAGRALAEAGPRPSQREIALALGYAGNGAFNRAFKRWSGLTPHQARARNGSGTSDGSG